MICPKCGNRIQEWAHGVCYTCARTEKEQQRFGKRRPASRTRKSGSKQSSLPEIVTCSACGQQVQTSKYAKHWRREHYEKATSSGLPRMGAQQRSRSHSEVVRNARHRRSEPIRRTRGSNKVRSEIAQNIQASRSKRRRKGINNLLQNIYGRPRFLSDILRDGGLSRNEIARLKRSHLDEYLRELVMRWEDWWKMIFSLRTTAILVGRYGLKGNLVTNHRTLAKRYRVTPGKIERLEVNSIGKLRRTARVRELERIVIQTAQEFLSRK